MTNEVTINIETVRIPLYRDHYGDLTALGESLATEGQRHPITLWKDGTLISGARRLRAHFIRTDLPATIRAVFVSTIEDAAKRLLIDFEDGALSLPMRSSEKCNLWSMLRMLDEPAALARAEAARRRGIELRKQTIAGKRKVGRSGYSTDYVLDILAPAFGMSPTGASRLWAIYMLASAPAQPEERRRQARESLRAIDAGTASLWAAYSALFAGRKSGSTRPKPAEKPAQSEPAAKQLATWSRTLPMLDGLVAGLVELGPPNPELTWDQVGPVHARLSAARRDLEQIIRKMKESAK